MEAYFSVGEGKLSKKICDFSMDNNLPWCAPPSYFSPVVHQPPAPPPPQEPLWIASSLFSSNKSKGKILIFSLFSPLLFLSLLFSRVILLNQVEPYVLVYSKM